MNGKIINFKRKPERKTIAEITKIAFGKDLKTDDEKGEWLLTEIVPRVKNASGLIQSTLVSIFKVQIVPLSFNGNGMVLTPDPDTQRNPGESNLSGTVLYIAEDKFNAIHRNVCAGKENVALQILEVGISEAMGANLVRSMRQEKSEAIGDQLLIIEAIENMTPQEMIDRIDDYFSRSKTIKPYVDAIIVQASEKAAQEKVVDMSTYRKSKQTAANDQHLEALEKLATDENSSAN